MGFPCFEYQEVTTNTKSRNNHCLFVLNPVTDEGVATQCLQKALFTLENKS